MTWIAISVAAALGLPPTDADYAQELDGISERLEVELDFRGPPFPVKTFYGPIDGAPALDAVLRLYVPVLKEELAFYSPAIIHRSKLKRIVLCRDLAFDGQRRSAIPDFEHDTLYLDVDPRTDDKDYWRRVIHHEYFHILDYRDDGEVYRDDAWVKLNPPGFEYGRGGKELQEDFGSGDWSEEGPGVLTRYAASGVEEDKAELFAWMMTDFQAVSKRAAKDDVVRVKTRAMQALLERFCEDFGDDFWERAANRGE